MVRPAGACPQERLQALAPDHPVGDQVPVPGRVAGGQHHQPVALLALPELGLGALAIADVLDGEHEMAGVPLRLGHQGDGDQAPGEVAAAAGTAVLRGVAGTFAREQEPHALAVRGPVVGVDQPFGEPAEQVLLLQAQHLAERLVDPGPPAVTGRHAHRDSGVLEDVGRPGSTVPAGRPGGSNSGLEHSKLDLGGRACCKILQQGEVAIRPESRHPIDHAEGADRMALAGDQRNAGVGDPSQLADGGVAPEQRMAPGVLDHQRLAGERPRGGRTNG